MNFEERKEGDIETTEDGKRAVALLYQLTDEKFSHDNINDLYNEMGSAGYDEWAKVVNFTEPFEIIKQVSNSKDEDCLAMDKGAELLDIGAGTGIIGRELTKAGFKNLWGLDATETFVVDLKT